MLCATHSPLLASLPGATLLEVGEHGLRQVDYEDLDLVRDWRDFLGAPDRYLRAPARVSGLAVRPARAVGRRGAAADRRS